MSDFIAIVANIQQEMRRGTLVLAVLSQCNEPQYGYSLIEALALKGITIEQNTLYPLMRRLEKQGLLESVWQLEENRPRRYYQISPLGLEVRTALIEDWKRLENTMSALIGGAL